MVTKTFFALALLIPVSVFAAATMQNDTESIALPSTVTGGQQTVIFDNPQLIQQWAQGSNDPYADYLAAVAGTLIPATDGSVTLSVGNDKTASPAEALLNTLGGDSGFAFSVSNSTESISSNTAPATIVISASKLRQALAEKGILSIIVLGWDFDDTQYVDDSAYYAEQGSITTSDVAVIAAAAVFRDQNIEEITLSGTSLTITYRTKGWLFGFIPIHFTVHLAINAAGRTDAERVSVTFPWYRFFTWLTLSPVGLARDLNAAIVGNQAAGLDPAESQARLFTHVTAILRTQNATDVVGLPPAATSATQ